jgi:hypothetical protein
MGEKLMQYYKFQEQLNRCINEVYEVHGSDIGTFEDRFISIEVDGKTYEPKIETINYLVDGKPCKDFKITLGDCHE